MGPTVRPTKQPSKKPNTADYTRPEKGSGNKGTEHGWAIIDYNNGLTQFSPPCYTLSTVLPVKFCAGTVRGWERGGGGQ